MTKVPIRKVKRVSVLTKRSQCLGKHYKERSYRPLYEKLKSNNRYLAKTLSQEKQTNQSLFEHNLDLIKEIQQLNLTCNKQTTVISNVLSNAKEVLTLLVTMTGYMTNTISMCQELATSTTSMRLSSASVGRKESSKRLSTKSPAKGVVKPMVGGHTITKPTINLSRVNMESINNMSRLSNIQEEVSTPNRSQEINENRSPIVVSIPSTPIRYNNNHTCRLPERLAVTPPRVNVTDEQRLKRKRSYTKRLTGSYSRSRWSDKSPINSQTKSINIINNRISDIENRENDDNAPRESSDRENVIQARRMSINANEEEETHAHVSKKSHNMQINNKRSSKHFNRNSNVITHSRSPNNTRNWEEDDPLEGPSWLFNNTMPSRDNEPEELDHLHISDVNNNTSQLMMYDDDSSNTESNVEEQSPLSNTNQSSEKNDSPTADRNEYDSYLHEHNADVNQDNAQDDFASFVTLRRGHTVAPEETEDFTLMLSHQPRQSVGFDIKELRLPVYDESINSINNGAIDTEVATAMPSVTSNMKSMNEPIYDKITIELKPLILINERVSPLQQTKHLSKNNKKARATNSNNGTSPVKNIPIIKSKTKSKKKSENNRDPSTAKVVLEKLNEYRVKSRSSPDDTESRSSNNSIKDGPFNEKESLQNSESMNSDCVPTRPRRRKAPINLKEPNCQKKLRRD